MSSPAPRKYPRTNGFRILWTDPIFILLAAFAAWKLPPMIGEMGLVPAIVLAHFFLFCNVFRVGTTRELIWTAIFLINCAAWTVLSGFHWWPVLAVQEPVTLAVILSAIFSREYHGIASRKWNPHVDEYLNG